MAARVEWPGSSDRVAVIGRTGSGKTVAGVWHLSGKDFQSQPWVVLNTKGDQLLNDIAGIEGVKNISLEEALSLPRFEPGLYIISTRPDQGEEIDALLAKIWALGNVGVYIDELYMIDVVDNMEAILTQGRSRNIPFIGLSQRPAWVSKFVFSEADFFQIFNLQIEDDRKKVASIVPIARLTSQQRGVNINARPYDYRLREHHSYWYNVKRDILVELSPVPAPDAILATFQAKFQLKQTPEVSQVTETVDVLDTRPSHRLM